MIQNILKRNFVMWVYSYNLGYLTGEGKDSEYLGNLNSKQHVYFYPYHQSISQI